MYKKIYVYITKKYLLVISTLIGKIVFTLLGRKIYYIEISFKELIIAKIVLLLRMQRVVDSSCKSEFINKRYDNADVQHLLNCFSTGSL